MRRSRSLRLFDFSGGLNTFSPVTTLKVNEAIDLQNINLLPSGGFEKRRGNTTFNSSAMVSSSTAVSGLGYFRKSDATDFMMAIAGTKVFKADSLDGTMDDVTGAVTITAGANNLWTCSTMNDLSIFVGGAPNSPIKFSGSGNAAALGGSPPSGNFGLTANNRFFIGNTSANPSRIAWSILGNPENWSGTGSGTQDVSANDGDVLIGGTIINNNHILLFKQNSIHDLIITTSPFPVFPLFRGVGAVSKRAIVNVDDMVYFITPQPRMKATDGTKVYSFPSTIDNVWDGLNSSRLQYIHGQYYPRLRQIWWFCSNGSSSTHDYCIVWDLERKAWLRHTTGFKMNSSVIASDRTPYAGSYDGKIYKLDVASTYTDASEASPNIINCYWRSGWISAEDIIESKSIPYVDVSFTSQTTGSFEFGYGFDFSSDKALIPVSMQGSGDKWDQFFWGVGKWGSLSDLSKIVFLKGGGKYFQFFIRNKNASEVLKFNGFEVPVRRGQAQALKA